MSFAIILIQVYKLFKNSLSKQIFKTCYGKLIYIGKEGVQEADL